ncbi:MAG: hypothetical protein GF308_21505 [Candidatus Heimdallarchaeota archaeon]|nr:hypothetical protein [Candidatus Heimdallarchaeota archaeon]
MNKFGIIDSLPKRNQKKTSEEKMGKKEFDQIEKDLRNFKSNFENRKVADFLVKEASRFLELEEFKAAKECIREALVRCPKHEKALKCFVELSKIEFAQSKKNSSEKKN